MCYGKTYKSLFTLDLLCHGVPSKRVFRDHIKSIELNTGHTVIRYLSRVKTPDQYMSSSEYIFEDKSYNRVSVYEDEFSRFFVSNFGLRPNCYQCRYACPERIGDITVADFWGYTPQNLKYRSYKKGTSLILINSSKGENLLKKIKNQILVEDRSLQEAASCNLNLSRPQEYPNRYDEFWTRYLAGESLSELADQYFPIKKPKQSFLKIVSVWIKMFIPYYLLTYINNIRKRKLL